MRKHGGGGNGRGFGGLATLFRLVRYGASTLVSAVVDVGFFVLFSSVLLTSLPDAPRLFVSTAAARVLSSLCNFFLNRFLVFGGEGRVAGSLWRYYTLWASLMVGTYLLTLGGTRLLPWPEWMIKLLSDMLLGLVSYQVQHRWVFPRTGTEVAQVRQERQERQKPGPVFRLSRALLRAVTPTWRVEGAPAPSGPAVYLVQHHYFQGPVRTLIWFDRRVHLWALAPFFNWKESTRRYRELTYGGKFHWPAPLAWAAAAPTAAVLRALLVSNGAVPVYRGSRRILETFDHSLRLLETGESLLICPDRDYENTTGDGAYYEGFLKLDQMFFRRCGCHVAFVPLLTRGEERRIYRGAPVYFSGALPYGKEKHQVLAQLTESWRQLAQPGRSGEN